MPASNGFSVTVQAFDAQIDATGMHATANGDAISIHTSAWGRVGATQPLPPIPPQADQRDLLLAHVGLVETWTVFATHLRQSWRVDEPPPGPGDLVVEVDVGAEAWQITGPDQAIIRGSAGRAWSYQDLRAWDSAGTQLDAHLARTTHGLALVVSDEGAQYPVFIDPDITVYGNYVASDGLPNDQFGGRVASAGDVNGDGYGDIIVGAQYDDGADTNVGSAYVFLGSASGIDASTQHKLTAQFPLARQHYGVVSSAGDVNGDGYDDVLVGAPDNDKLVAGAGAVYLHLGSANGVGSPESVQLVVANGLENDGFGSALSAAGDLNGDGFDDVVIGSPRRLNWQGAVYVFMGSALGLTTETELYIEAPDPQSSAAFGVSVTAAGDVNGDGYDDVVVGAPGVDGLSPASGAAYLYFGSPGGLDPAAALKIFPGTATQDFGVSVSGAGDVDADGYDDVIIGDTHATTGPSWSYDGAAYVFFGDASGVVPGAERMLLPGGGSPNNLYAANVAGLGDLDGDGYDDVGVAAEEGSSPVPQFGSVRLYFGGPTGPGITEDAILWGTANQLGFASALSAAGDPNNDGLSELLVGIRYDVTDRGAVQVFGSCLSGTDWYEDADGDGRGDPNSVVNACNQPVNFVDNTLDCDDTERFAWTGRLDVCDGVDNDCDGIADNGPGQSLWFADADRDSFGDANTSIMTCFLPWGYTRDTQDCDDTRFEVNPLCVEVCDGRDTNCDGEIDNAADGELSFADTDGDGRGDPNTLAPRCASDPLRVFNDDDCDDQQPLAWDLAEERCDGVDNDCDGDIDPGCTVDAPVLPATGCATTANHTGPWGVAGLVILAFRRRRQISRRITRRSRILGA